MPTTFARSAWCAMLALMLVEATGCVSWRRESVPEEGTRAADRLPSRVRVATSDGRELTIWYPEIHHDTLVGAAGGGRSREDTVSVRVAAADIRRLDARRPSLTRSVLLVAGIFSGFIALIAVALGGHPD